MDWQKILESVKNFFIKVWEVLAYYVPLIIGKIWEGLKFIGRKIKKWYKKASKWCKRYVKMMVKHAKKGDYSLIIYAALTLIAVILILVLLIHAIGCGKSKKTTTTTETTTEIVTTEDPAVAQQNQLISDATAIYQNNQALLILVNSTHPLDSSYSFEHHTLNCGKDVDARELDDLKNMLTACNDAGNEYSIINAYISRDTEQANLDAKVAEIVASEGLSQEEATTKALETVPAVGCDEHETGLAIDITSVGVTSIDQYSADNATDQWLINNCYQYGFIQRYPSDKSSITGVSNSQWQFRYVGIEAATFMHNNNLTLEEFYNLLGM